MRSVQRFVRVSAIVLLVGVLARANTLSYNGYGYYLNGMNVPWHQFGTDVGTHYQWGHLYDSAWFETFFSQCQAFGVNSVRLWIHCDGRSTPEFDASGNVTGLESTFFPDFDDILLRANNHHVMVMPCLWSFDMTRDNTAGAGRYGGMHADLIRDPAKTQTYINNALIPMVRRYANTPNLVAWEIINEPEWSVSGIEAGGTVQQVTKTEMQRFCAMIAAAIHQNSPKMVTVGSASLKWNSDLKPPCVGNLWSDAALQAAYNAPGAKLDFYQIHYYDWMNPWYDPYTPGRTPAYWKLDKPVIIGETPAGNGIHSVSEIVNNAWTNGYAGIMPWSYADTLGGSVGWNNVKNQLKSFRDAHASIVDFPGVGGGGGGGSGPYGGTAWTLPGKVETENYDLGGEASGFHDTTAGNSGGAYRSDAVDLEATADAAGGVNVGWTQAGEWLKYTVNVAAAGTYSLSVRVASSGNGGSFHVEFGGTNKTGTLTVPNTGGWQTWQTLTVGGVGLPAGTQTMRIVMDANGPNGWIGNFNYVQVSASGGTGLTGQYFDNRDFTSPRITRIDPTVNFDWGSGTPDGSVAADTFSVRWTGQVEAPASGSYTFITVSDDGIRLWVNGLLLVDNWTDHAPMENSGVITLSAGQKVAIKIEYYENGGGAVAKLLWSGPGVAKQVVPQARLYP